MGSSHEAFRFINSENHPHTMNKLAADHKLTTAQRVNIAHYGFAVASSIPALGLNKEQVIKRASVFRNFLEKKAARHDRLVAIFREHVTA